VDACSVSQFIGGGREPVAIMNVSGACRVAALYVAETYSTAMRFLIRSYAMSDKMCLCINSVLS
jgi:hypothetical protein